MGLPVLLAENFLNIRQFASHAIAANEEATGHQVFRVADGRRSGLDYWTPVTANAQATITVQCDRTRVADCFVLDRGHNLAGKEVILECSDDAAFGTGNVQTCFDVFLPSSSATGDIDDALGVRTDEGAWIKRFSARSALYWRIRIPAMGASLKPQIVGAWVGQSYSPGFLKYPHEPDVDELRVLESETEGGARGSNTPINPRSGSLQVRLTTLLDYEVGRYHLQFLFGARKPTWLVHDEERAERALLAIRVPGRAGLGQTSDYFYPNGNIPWIEYEVLRP